MTVVKDDVIAMLTDSKEFWPADFGNYGPFLMRLSWHAAGSYRISDGRGGSDGGRMRFFPEESWPDNTNLDKARTLLWPIKEKYGDALSWADLFIMAGTAAIEGMGGPILGFCAGRTDDTDGSASLPLGPSAIQEELYPCPNEGNCTSPLGPTTVGLIYVNPAGPKGVPDPMASAADIRDSFGRMGMNDTETVALIGGGHTFGKCHGACPAGAGPTPAMDPENPWPGLCGTGSGADTSTSGFEGPWTSSPTTWDNDYFKNLLNFNWLKIDGPGGNVQWSIDGADSTALMMLTSDVALITDPEYLTIVQKFATDLPYYEKQFSHAWYKLMTRDMGPHSRCQGNMVPEAQPFQMPLPSPSLPLPNFGDVAKDIIEVIEKGNDVVLPLDSTGTYGPLFVRLAWQCASTYRATDYAGGCNGARIRFSPEKDWPKNALLNKALDLLQPVKDKYGAALSWADLIVLSGSIAIEDAASRNNQAITVPFTGGRTDALATDPSTPASLEGRLGTGGSAGDTVALMKDSIDIMGLLSNRQFVALMGGGHSMGQMHNDRSGFISGSWTSAPAKLDNEYFINLSGLKYMKVVSTDGQIQYKATTAGGTEVYMLKTDMNLIFDGEFKSTVQDYASSEKVFYEDFVSAWTTVMNAGLEQGSDSSSDSTSSSSGDNDYEKSTMFVTGIVLFLVGIVALAVAVALMLGGWNTSSNAKGEKVAMIEDLKSEMVDPKAEVEVPLRV